MAKIKYKFSNGVTKEIEVTEEYAKAYLEIESESNRIEERYKWLARKHETRLDSILDQGGGIEDENADFFEKQYRYEDLYNAISTLSNKQQWLIQQLYFNCRTKIDVAKELGISETAVRHRLDTILKRLKSNII